MFMPHLRRWFLLARTVAHTNSTGTTGRHIRLKKGFQKVDKFMREVRRAEETLRYRKEELHE